MKRALSIILSLVLVFTATIALTPSSFAGNFPTYGNFAYSVYSGEATIREYLGGSTDTVVIPASINGYPVKSVATDFKFAKVSNIVIEEGIEYFDYINHYNNSAVNPGTLHKITFPSTIKRVLGNCFVNGKPQVIAGYTGTQIEEYAHEWSIPFEATGISLKEASTRIKGGNTYQIKPQILWPSGVVSYETKNKKVATVNSNGLVTGVASGSTQIVVKYQGVSSVFDVTVLAYFDDDTVYYSNTSRPVEEGDSMILHYAAEDTTWRSTDRSIARVDENGEIYISDKTGTCKIIAVSGGIEYSYTLIVGSYPDFYGTFVSKNDKSRTVKVKIKNCATKPMVIYSSGAGINNEKYYKSRKYDRYIKMANGKKSVTVKSGKTANITFKIKGPKTKNGKKDFYIVYKIGFCGKKYTCWAFSDTRESTIYHDKTYWYSYWE